MSEIVKTVILNSNGEEITAPYVERDVQITKRMRVPLYVAGRLKSDEELAELGLTVRRYTQEELDAIECEKLYAANPDLAKRVREYKGYLDQIGINDYSANTDTIEEAVAMSVTIEDKEAFVLRIKTAFDNIVLNLQAVNEEANAFTAWSMMTALIANLPEEPEAEPETEPETEPTEQGAE